MPDPNVPTSTVAWETETGRGFDLNLISRKEDTQVSTQCQIIHTHTDPQSDVSQNFIGEKYRILNSL